MHIVSSKAAFSVLIDRKIEDIAKKNSNVHTDFVLIFFRSYLDY